MNKKGEGNMNLGVIMVVFITIIVGVVLFQVIAQEVGKSTNTVGTGNASLGSAAVNGTAQYLPYRSLSDVIIYNATGDVPVPTSNYTVTNNVINPTTGALAVSVTPNDPDAGYQRGVWTVDATAQPLTYIAESGGRAIANIIAIFFALAIVIVSITPVLRDELFSMVRG